MKDAAKPVPPGAEIQVGESDDGARVVAPLGTEHLVLVEADGTRFYVPKRLRRSVLGSRDPVRAARRARQRPCPCGCGGAIEGHDDRGWGRWACPVCEEESDRDFGRPCSDCEEVGHADRR